MIPGRASTEWNVTDDGQVYTDADLDALDAEHAAAAGYCSSRIGG
jgi:hypothetical protein